MPASHVIYYVGPTSMPHVQNLRNTLALFSQPNQNVTELLIVFSSFGGSTFEARSTYGMLRALPYPVHIHAVGCVQSAAIPLMLGADKRTAAPDTEFLFHPWSWGLDANPGYHAERLEQYPMQLQHDVAWAKSIFQSRAGLSARTIGQMKLFEKPRIEDANFALAHGFVQQVTQLQAPTGVTTYNIAV